MKRTQRSVQAAGDFASPQRLIQPHKCDDVEADLVTLRGRQHRHEYHGERVSVPPGSNKIVACSQRSQEMNSPEDVVFQASTLNSGGFVAVPVENGRSSPVTGQPTEDGDECEEESDLPILLRDGGSDHMGKGRAEKHSKQSTYRGNRWLPITGVKLLACVGQCVS